MVCSAAAAGLLAVVGRMAVIARTGRAGGPRSGIESNDGGDGNEGPKHFQLPKFVTLQGKLDFLFCQVALGAFWHSLLTRVMLASSSSRKEQRGTMGLQGQLLSGMRCRKFNHLE